MVGGMDEHLNAVQDALERSLDDPERSLDDSHRSLIQLRGGDTLALDRLIGTVRPFLKHQVLELVGRNRGAQDDASDVVQRALMQAIEQLDSFQGKTTAEWRSWLSAIAKNKALDSHRYWSSTKRQVQRVVGVNDGIQALASNEKSPSAVAIGAENSIRLELALRRLEPNDRQIIEYSQFEGLDHASIGQRLGISEAASRQRLKTALERLRKAWKSLSATDQNAPSVDREP